MAASFFPSLLYDKMEFVIDIYVAIAAMRIKQ